ncbi:MAG: hypothetical protein ABIF01_01010 [Candidatus Micrarchaeota archaeon]
MEAKMARKADWSPDSAIGYYCPGKQNAFFYYLKTESESPGGGAVNRWKPGSRESGMVLDFRLKPNVLVFNTFRPLDETIMREPSRRARLVYR